MIRCCICGASAGMSSHSAAAEYGWSVSKHTSHGKNDDWKGQPILICPKCTAPVRALPQAAN